MGGAIPDPELDAEWTKHRAPTGHFYYYNKRLKKSTYDRKLALATFENPKNALEKLPGWWRVTTKKGRVFVYDETNNKSYWYAPNKQVEDALISLYSEKDEILEMAIPSNKNDAVEFTEQDIAWQLELLYNTAVENQQQDKDDQEKEQENHQDEEMRQKNFYDLLDKFNCNPFDTWDNVAPIIMKDSRYTLYTSDRSRSAAYSKWCFEKIKRLENKQDCIKTIDINQSIEQQKLYLELAKKAIKKENLYWIEFKRKYRTLPDYNNLKSESERETLYRALQSALKLTKEERERNLLVRLENEFGRSKEEIYNIYEQIPAIVETFIEYFTLPKQESNRICQGFFNEISRHAGKQKEVVNLN